MEIITAVKGFKDILPPETDTWRRIEATAIDVFRTFGFSEIRIPLLEKTELFRRGIGEPTDIVEKEMYTFVDRGEESLTLRPEATASVIRAYLEHAFLPLDRLQSSSRSDQCSVGKGRKRGGIVNSIRSMSKSWVLMTRTPMPNSS